MKLRYVAAAFVAAVGLVVGGMPGASDATGNIGFDRVTSPGASASGTGYGPGWVGLSGPGVNDPIVGYLFYYDGDAGNAADHMDIFNSNSYTYPRGYAYGQFGGCAYAYTFSNFYLESATPHSGDCTPPYAGMTKAQLFCSNTAADPLCPGYGAYQTILNRNIVAWSSTDCPAYANLTAAPFRGSAVAGTPHNFLGYLGNGQPVGVRYITKADDYAMVIVGTAANPTTVNGNYPGLWWVFVPRHCLG